LPREQHSQFTIVRTTDEVFSHHAEKLMNQISSNIKEGKKESYFKVLSKLAVAKQFISGIHVISLIGASCIAIVTG
jgi:hypothetical protein